jgi:hypothetical protein
MSSTPRDPSKLTDADLSTMTEEEEALYYEANAHRLDEIFDEDAKVEFEVPEDATTTITVRLKRSELDVLSQAAELRDLKLSTFVREAAMLVARSPQATALPGDVATVNRKLAAVKKQISDLEGLIASKPAPSRYKRARTGAAKSRIAVPKAAQTQPGARAPKSA